MTRDKHRLLKAVELLDEAAKMAIRLEVSKGSRGSARALSIRLRKARDLLWTEVERSDPDWAGIVAVLLQAAKWVGAVLIDNIQYKCHLLRSRYESVDRGDRLCA